MVLVAVGGCSCPVAHKATENKSPDGKKMPYEDVDNLQSIIHEEVLLFF